MILLKLDITITRGAPPNADIIFASTDRNGTPGELNRYVLGSLDRPIESMPNQEDLRLGYAVQAIGSTTLVYIVTVDGNSVQRNLEKNLTMALNSLDLYTAQSLWIPLMGTGAGGLGVVQSLRAILDALENNNEKFSFGTSITISAPPGLSKSEFDALQLTYQLRIGSGGDAYIADRNARIAEDSSTLEVTPEYRYSSDVIAVIQLASKLAKHRRSPSVQISTSLLLFSITSTELRLRWDRLVDPTPARHFSTALRSLAGPKYDQAWRDYFTPSSAYLNNQDADSPVPLKFTLNVLRLLKYAHEKSTAVGRAAITLTDLLDAVFSLRDGGFYYQLSQMDVTFSDLVSDYQRRVIENATDSTAERTIRGYLVHDRATSEDRMDFDKYALGIADFLRSSDTVGPISISIQAPWGAGKSSLMQQVREVLDPASGRGKERGHATTRMIFDFLNKKKPATPRGTSEVRLESEAPTESAARIAAADARLTQWTIWFNAWKYESSEQVWAGLVDAIVSQVSDRLNPVERELFLLRLNLARIDDTEVRKKIYDKLTTYGWAGARWLLAVAAVVPAVLMWLVDARPAQASMATLAGVGIALTLWLKKTWKKVLDEPASFSLAQYIRVPEYGKSAGIIHHIHEDLQRIISILPKSRTVDSNLAVTLPLVIFVDDLDRCSPNKVASIVEGINTFLAGDQREFMFVIGMDPQIVAAALEHAHKDLRNQLPRYEQQAPLGWRFMDKFVQLAFTIPPRRSDTIEHFVSSLTKSARTAEEAPVENQSDSPPPLRVAADSISSQIDSSGVEMARQLQTAISKTVTNESQDVHDVMSGIIKQFHCSPREIKRILNFVRFVLLLRVGRIAQGSPVPTLALYQRWIILCIRWPEMVRWLQWGSGPMPGPAHEHGLESLTAHRLWELERASFAPGNEIQKWAQAAATELGLPVAEVSWLTDPDLHRFFVNEIQQPQDKRLSHGASIGFY